MGGKTEARGKSTFFEITENNKFAKLVVTRICQVNKWEEGYQQAQRTAREGHECREHN